MTPSPSAGRIDCPRHDEAAARLGPRDVDMQAFRHACADLLSRLEELGPSDDEEREQERQSLMRSVDGVLTAGRCGQTMIVTF